MPVMNLILQLIDIFMHIDVHLNWMIDRFGIWFYFIIFLVIFLETALVFTPFLPGDSLIFAVGALAAVGSFNVLVLFVLLALAAVLGDTVNYSIGHFLGKKIINMKSRFIKKEHIDKTQHFFDKYGSKTIVIARFIPVVRTFAPFLAGIGEMNYWKFLTYNIVGGLGWVALFLFGGFFFGNIQFVKDNFSYVIIGIIATSLLPVIYEVIRHKMAQRKKK
jgi:membrane-associated protein